MHVAEATLPPSGDEDPLAILGKVGEKAFLIGHEGPEGHVDDEIIPPLPVAARSLAIPSALGIEAPAVLEPGQRIKIAIALEDHVAPSSAVAAIRAPERNVLLAPKAGSPIAPTPCLHRNSGLIQETRSDIVHGLDYSPVRDTALIWYTALYLRR
jgi:hypothetical protein